MHKTIEKTERLCKMMNRLSELMETHGESYKLIKMTRDSWSEADEEP